MKTFSAQLCRSRISGFTLIEMLVVMGIIAILASVLFTAGTAAMNAAKRAKANSMGSQLATGAINYYTEYGVYPIPTGVTGDYSITDMDGGSWGNLLTALCGNHNTYSNTSATSTVPNTRGIAFLSLKASDIDSQNAPLNPLPTGGEIYFNIVMDGNYDGVVSSGMPSFLNNSFSASGGSSTAGVAVWANCNGTATTTNPSFYVHTY